MWYLFSKSGGRPVTWEEKKVPNLDTGPLDKRLEAAITAPMDEAINALAKELAGSKSPKMFRSKAARRLIAMGVESWRREQAKAGKVSA